MTNAVVVLFKILSFFPDFLLFINRRVLPLSRGSTQRHTTFPYSFLTNTGQNFNTEGNHISVFWGLLPGRVPAQRLTTWTRCLIFLSEFFSDFFFFFFFCLFVYKQQTTFTGWNSSTAALPPTYGLVDSPKYAQSDEGDFVAFVDKHVSCQHYAL